MTHAIPVLARVCLPAAPMHRALRVALGDPDAAAAEWEAWESDPISPESSLRDPQYRLRRLFPLIEASVRRSRVEIGRPLRDYLRMGTAHERMRWEVIEPLLGKAFRAMQQNRVTFLVMRGAALATQVYANPSLRHCHDLDLLVPPGEAAGVARILMDSGFVPVPAPPGSDASSRWVADPSGFPIGIHERLFRLPPWNSDQHNVEHLYAQSMELTIAGYEVRSLPPEEMLAAVCIHAVTVGSRHSPCWVTDAWHLLASQPQWNWDRTLALGPSIPLWLTLDWLAREIHAPIPGDVVSGLRETIADIDPDVEQQLIAAALLCAQGRPGDLLRSAKESGASLAWFRQLAIPEANVLRWTEHSSASPMGLHLRRIRRFLGASGGS